MCVEGVRNVEYLHIIRSRLLIWLNHYIMGASATFIPSTARTLLHALPSPTCTLHHIRTLHHTYTQRHDSLCTQPHTFFDGLVFLFGLRFGQFHCFYLSVSVVISLLQFLLGGFDHFVCRSQLLSVGFNFCLSVSVFA